ncbi:MAG: MerR family transcriptional regulator [Planctomycetes bacterium]|nr:MerR family transcriptional regulator [Planctomycetota bacterium]
MSIPDPKSLYSVGAIARETGISPDTLRVWERRYGQPEAVRLPSGHRRYTEEQLHWLRRVSEGMARGFRPGKLLRMDRSRLDELLAGCEAPPSADGSRWVGSMLEAAAGLDSVELRGLVLRSREALGALPWLVEVITPFLRQVGESWTDGSLCVRHEHLATGVVQASLHAALLKLTGPPGPPEVLCATLPGEQHGLGMLMAGLVIAGHGFQVRILGPDLPTEELLEAITTTQAPIVALSVSLAGGGVEADRQIRELERQLPAGAALMVGGAGARSVRRGVRGVIYLESLMELEAWARERTGKAIRE